MDTSGAGEAARAGRRSCRQGRPRPARVVGGRVCASGRGPPEGGVAARPTAEALGAALPGSAADLRAGPEGPDKAPAGRDYTMLSQNRLGAAFEPFY